MAASGQDDVGEVLRLAGQPLGLGDRRVELAVDRLDRKVDRGEVERRRGRGLGLPALLHAGQRLVVAVGPLAQSPLTFRLLRIVPLRVELGRLFGPRLVLLAHARAAEAGADEAVRMARQQVRDDAAAHRVAVEVRLADAQVVQHRDHVGRHRVAWIFGRIVRLLAAAVAARIDADHPVVARQLLGDPVGEPACVAAARVAVQQHDGRAFARLHPVDPHAVGHRQIAVLHVGRGLEVLLQHRHRRFSLTLVCCQR